MSYCEATIREALTVFVYAKQWSTILDFWSLGLVVYPEQFKLLGMFCSRMVVFH